MNNYKRGLSYAFAASVISGISIFLNKFAVDSVKSPILLTTTKNILVGLVFFGFLVLLGKWKKTVKLSRNKLFKLLLISLIGGSIPFYLFFTGLANTSAINAAIIQKSLVIWVAILASLYLKEKVSLIGALSVALLFLGNTNVGGFKGFSYSNGELMILIATVLWAVESILAKKILKSVDVEIVAAFRMGVGSLLLLSFMLITNPAVAGSFLSFNPEQVFWIGITSVLLLGYVYTWYEAISMSPVVVVTAVLVISTLITNVLSAVRVTHTWTEGMMIQAVIISIGVLVGYVAFGRLLRKTERVLVADGA